MFNFKFEMSNLVTGLAICFREVLSHLAGQTRLPFASFDSIPPVSASIIPSVLIVMMVVVLVVFVTSVIAIIVSAAVATTASFLLSLVFHVVQYGCTNNTCRKYSNWTKSC
jgi:hypothetical protein